MANKPKEKSEPQIIRRYKGKQEIHHDLFKLESAKMLIDKSVGKIGDPDMLIPTEHCHFYHTVDSSGAAMEHCHQIGGHFHKVEVSVNEKGELEAVCMSGPLKHALRKERNGKMTKIVIPVNDYDDHMHDVTYIDSHKVQKRKANVEASKVMVNMNRTQTAADLQGDPKLGKIVEGS